MRILLAGDSWGCGEWKAYNPKLEGRPDAIAHKGLEEYLTQDNHEVKNVSVPGCSLKSIYYKLRMQGKKHLLDKEVEDDSKPYKPYDATFVIVTDALRDIERGTIWDNAYSYQDYVDMHNNQLREFIADISRINNKILGQVYLMGGLSKVTSDLLKDTQLKIAIPSILEFLVPNSKQHDVIFLHHHHTISKHNTNKQAVKRIHAQNNLWELYTKESIMWPDGHHPNREGHFKIYQYLKENKFLS